MQVFIHNLMVYKSVTSCRMIFPYQYTSFYTQNDTIIQDVQDVPIQDIEDIKVVMEMG